MAGLAERGLVDLSPNYQAPDPRQWGHVPRWPIWRWAFAVAALATILALAATPTGDAVARWVGDVFGIGEPGGTPSLDSRAEPPRRDPASPDAPTEVVGPVVLATGQASGFRVELTSSRNTEGDLCLNADFPEIAFHITACPDRSKTGRASSRHLRAPVVDNVSSEVPGLDGRALLAGRAPPGTVTVHLYQDSSDKSAKARAVAAVVADPDPQVREKAGLDQATVYFAAVISRDAGGGQAVALDSDGRSLGSKRFQLNAGGRSMGPDVYAD